MWGWRARIGFIVPDCDPVQESDMFHMAPEGVWVHFTRKHLGQPFGVQDLYDLSSNLDGYVKLLTSLGLSVIVFGDTFGSFVGGPGYDQKMIERMAKTSGVKATTTATSVVAALKGLRMKKISVLTPYPHEVNEALLRFFEGNGFKILQMKELELDTDPKICSVPPETIYYYGKEVFAPEADGLFISCTTFRAADAIEDLETDLGKSVVTPNQATMWNALRMAGIKDRIDGYGQLFKRL